MPTWTTRIRSVLRRGLARAGVRLESTAHPRPECFARLGNMRRLGFAPKLVFDCGAFVGEWTRSGLGVFPDAHFVLMEPNPEILPQTRDTVASLGSRAELLEVALSDEEGESLLRVWAGPEDSIGAQGASLLGHVRGEAAREYCVAARTLEDVAQNAGALPDLVKLDLQGAELAALSGAGDLLGGTELFIVEFGCLEAYEQRTTPRELLELFDEAGYCLYDVVDLGYRPRDGALCSGDFFFLRRDSKLRRDRGYE